MTLPGVLIDSGASCNVIDQATWEVLKKKSVQCESKKSSEKLFAYTQKDPIEVIGHLCLRSCARSVATVVWTNSQWLKVQGDLNSERTLQRSWAC